MPEWTILIIIASERNNYGSSISDSMFSTYNCCDNFIYPAEYTIKKKAQMVLAVFQVALCGWFFALSLSDYLDVGVNFSLTRFILDFFYCMAFLSLAVYTVFNINKTADSFLKGVIWASIVLIAMQCFVFPYGSDIELIRIFESVEGALVFGLMIAVALNLWNTGFCRKALIAIIVLEYIVAVENVIVPLSSITGDF